MTRKAGRKDVTKWLSALLMRDIFNVPSGFRYWASEVTLDRRDYAPGKTGTIRVDFMQFTPLNKTPGGIDRGEFSCYEVKSCMEDFKSENGHNLVGDKNYYVTTSELFEKLRAADPHLKQLVIRPSCRAGVLVPIAHQRPVSSDEYNRLYETECPWLTPVNPFTGLRDTVGLTCALKPDVNRRRPYSNSEMLFAMMRSAGRDRKQYENGFWREL